MAALFVAYSGGRYNIFFMNQRLMIIIPALAALGIQTAVQAAQPPIQLKPSSPWIVNNANDSCRLARQFGEGDQLVLAFFDRYGPGEQFRLTLAGTPVKTAIERSEVVIQFGPGEAKQEVLFYGATVDKMPAIVFASSMRVASVTDAEKYAIEKQKDGEAIEFAPISIERQKAIRNLTIGKPLRRTVTLETGSMHGALGALDKCIDNLMTIWGIDVEKHKSLTRITMPLGNPAAWVVPSDYPIKMLRSGQPAIVEFRVSVGADGTPTACHIQSTTRPKEFDDAVCKSIMRRARFDPALDAEGQPLASYYRNTVRFQMPR